MEGDQLWEQQVSVAPSTREDVSGLEELLDMKLQQWQARGTGICPLRRKLFSQCFGDKEAEIDRFTELHVDVSNPHHR